MKQVFSLICGLAALFCLSFSTVEAAEAARSGLVLCASTILPSLFPFLILTLLLSKLGFSDALARILAKPAAKLFGVSGAGASAFLIGILGGYPLGAGYIAQLLRTHRIDADEAEHLLLFCNCSGPAFLIGAVGGGVFHNAAIGMRLYGIHILSSLLIGILFRTTKSPTPLEKGKEAAPPFSIALQNAVSESVGILLNVSAFIVCFSVVNGLLEAWGFYSLLPNEFLRVLIRGMLELGNGVGALKAWPVSKGSLVLCAFMVGFGSISVWMQTNAVLFDSSIKSAPHIAGRLLNAAFSAALAYLFF